MTTLIHADIFFFISTIALVLVSVGIIVALVYLIKILRNVSEVSDKVKEESAEIITDIRHLRSDMKREGFRMQHVGQFFARLFRRRVRSKRDY